MKNSAGFLIFRCLSNASYSTSYYIYLRLFSSKNLGKISGTLIRISTTLSNRWISQTFPKVKRLKESARV